MKLSIIIPVYNVEKYLENCLSTLCAQKSNDVEFIIVNDGTKDNSEIIIKKYMQIDKRIKYVVKENGGLSSARNAGLKHISGSYITFLDSDDIVERDYIEKILNKIDDNNYDIIFFDSYRFYEEKFNERVCYDCLRKASNNKTKFLLSYIKHAYGFEVWNKVYSKEIINKYSIEFTDNKKIFAEDLCFNTEFLYHCDCIGFIHAPLYNYMMRSTSIMGVEKGNIKIDRFINLLNSLQGKIDKKTLSNVEFPLLLVTLNEHSFEDNYQFIIQNDLKNSIEDVIKRSRFKSFIGSITMINKYGKKNSINAYLYTRILKRYLSKGKGSGVFRKLYKFLNK